MRQRSLSYRDSHCALNRTKSSYDNTELGRVIHSFQKTYKLLSAEGIKWGKKSKAREVPQMNHLTGWEIKSKSVCQGDLSLWDP